MRPPTASCWTWPLPCCLQLLSVVYHFGMHALLVLIVTVAACVLSEYVYEKLMHRPITIMDGSALVTGMILALNMPPEIPVWIPVIGGIFAIVVVKQLYGGLGQNFMNRLWQQDAFS